MCWVLYLNLVIEYLNVAGHNNLAIILIFFSCFRAMTLQLLLHLVVNWEVFTINLS